MSVRINLGVWGSVFAVPTCVADNDIKIASGYQLKVLLLLLRNSEKSMSYEEIGQNLSMHPDDVKDSIQFWITRGVLCEAENDLLPSKSSTYDTKKISGEIKKEVVVEQQENIVEGPTINPRPLTRPQRPGIQFVSAQLVKNPELSALMDEAQTILNKPLASGDISTIYMLYDTYGLPAEVLLMLMQYCVSVERPNMHFIEKEGIRWSDDGIASIEQAEQKIYELKNRYNAWGTVSRIFGIQNAGSPSKTQLDYANTWINDWKFAPELLREAYERCVDAKGKFDIRYVNGILNNWHKNSVFTIHDVLERDKESRREKEERKEIEYKNKNKPQESASTASYDIDKLENSSIFDD